MSLTKKEWTPDEAEKWTKEDSIAVLLSPIVYIMLMIGTALSMLLITAGFVILAVGILTLIVMVRAINPKLTVVSREYEEKQKQYLEELEKKIKWED